MGDKTRTDIEDCVSRPKCFVFKILAAFAALSAFFLALYTDDAAQNVNQGKLRECTHMPIICGTWLIFFVVYIGFYFLLTCYNWGQPNEKIEICCFSPVPKLFTLIFIGVSIWTFYDFFQLNQECRDYIQAEGSNQAWLAYQVLTYSLVVVYSCICFLVLVLFPCWLFCCFMKTEGWWTQNESTTTTHMHTQPFLTVTDQEEVWTPYF